MKREKGGGSLYQATDKTWVYQYKVDGVRKTKRFRLKADAKAYIESLNKEAQIIAERGMTPSAIQNLYTIGSWMDHWLENYAKPAIKLSTYCSYEMYIRAHIKPQVGEKYMNMVTVDDMQKFFLERSKKGNQKGKGGLAPKTLVNLRNMMHASFSQAVKNKVMAENVIEGVRLPRMERKEMRVLSRNEQGRLIEATKRAPEPAAFGIVFDLFTGLRLGELCGLRWPNVDMEKRAVHICETRNRLPNFDDSIRASTSVKTTETTKTESSRRTVYMSDSLFHDFKYYHDLQMSIMEEYPGYNPEGYVFCQENGDPYEPRTYQDLFKRCVKQAGIPDANFHCLRHTFATRALEQGMDVTTVAKILGHANPSVTLEKYAHALDEHKRISMEKMNEVYAGCAAQTGKPLPKSQQGFGLEMKL